MIRRWNEALQIPRGSFQISWPGCGVLVFWQLGALKRLSEMVDIQKLPMLGSSSGALVACLGACGVDADRAAHELVTIIEKNVKARGLGIFGSLGLVGREWLHSMLPPDAGDRCSSKSTLLLTSMPAMLTWHVDTFKSKEEVIDVAMASSHLPYLVNGDIFAKIGKQYFLDGGLHWWLRRSESEYHPPGITTLLVHPVRDETIEGRYHQLRRMEVGGLPTKARELFQAGRDFVDRRLDVCHTGGEVIIHERPVLSPVRAATDEAS